MKVKGIMVVAVLAATLITLMAHAAITPPVHLLTTQIPSRVEVSYNYKQLADATVNVTGVAQTLATMSLTLNSRTLRVEIENTSDTETIYFAYSSNVTADSDAATSGKKLLPNERRMLNWDSYGDLYFIASGSCYMRVTEFQ